MFDLHSYFLEFNAGEISVSVSCPYPAIDCLRPCWPQSDGEFLPAPQDACIFAEWLTSVPLREVMSGSFRLPIQMASISWENNVPTFEVLHIEK